MTNQLTRDQFADLKEEEQKLYREVWLRRRPDSTAFVKCNSHAYDNFESYEKYAEFRKGRGWETRQVYERIPVEPLATLKVGDSQPMHFQLELMNDSGYFYLTLENGVLSFNTPKGTFQLSPETVSHLRQFIDMSPAPPVDTVEQHFSVVRGLYNENENLAAEAFKYAAENGLDSKGAIAYAKGYKAGKETNSALLSSQQREIEGLREQLKNR